MFLLLISNTLLFLLFFIILPNFITCYDPFVLLSRLVILHRTFSVMHKSLTMKFNCYFHFCSPPPIVIIRILLSVPYCCILSLWSFIIRIRIGNTYLHTTCCSLILLLNLILKFISLIFLFYLQSNFNFM